MIGACKKTIARQLSLVENEGAGCLELLKSLYPKFRDGYVIGITGPPGSGKSTLTDKLAKLLLDSGEKTGIIAVDPTSPFTKGAILGDRIRMSSVSAHPGAFIRSMGSRGYLGGLSKAASGAAVVLAAAGFTYIFIETVGVGQSEIDIAGLADTAVMVLSPGQGDDIQAIKAGIMEIGDVFAINKADKEGAEKTFRETLASLDFKTDWGFKPPVCRTVAETGEGAEVLLENIMLHMKYLRESGEFTTKRSRKKAELVRNIVRDKFALRVDEFLAGRGDLGDKDPYTLAEEIFTRERVI